MSVTYSQKIGSNSKGDSLTFINKGNSFTRSNVDGTINTVDDIKRSDLRINKNL